MSDPDRRLSERLHGIADHSMSIIIGSMVQEMITELKMRESPGYPGHISFTLTDAEREAVEFCIASSERDVRSDIVAAARAAVARLGGGR